MRIIRLVTALHVLIYRLTGGAIGGLMSGAPVVLLTTIGRKSGRRFTVPLLSLNHGQAFAIIASFGGAPKDPQWWSNVKHSGHAWLQVGQHRWAVAPEEVEGAVRQEIWDALTQLYPQYDDYQKKTSRVIPVVLLHPANQAR